MKTKYILTLIVIAVAAIMMAFSSNEKESSNDKYTTYEVDICPFAEAEFDLINIEGETFYKYDAIKTLSYHALTFEQIANIRKEEKAFIEHGLLNVSFKPIKDRTGYMQVVNCGQGMSSPCGALTSYVYNSSDGRYYCCPNSAPPACLLDPVACCQAAPCPYCPGGCHYDE